jgi:transcriptional regulator with XRE-family HTH domain
MNHDDIRAKRAAAGIPGLLVSRKASISRTRLSDIERGYVPPTANELARIDAAIDELARVREEINRLAAAAGWPR